jgi:hypothetical protein
VVIETELGYDSYHDLNTIADSLSSSMEEISRGPERTDCEQSPYFRQFVAEINGKVLLVVRGHRFSFNSFNQLALNLYGVGHQKTINSYHIQETQNPAKIISTFVRYNLVSDRSITRKI